MALSTSPRLVVTSSNSNTPQSTQTKSTPSSLSKSKAWISGVVVGPFAGIALGAAFMWVCLRNRKTKKAQQNQATLGHDQVGSYQQYPSTVPSDSQGPKVRIPI
ncbi:hypothetical protein GQ44DRAFT_727037 [Phaeosphaeriaceae sp. PMI808]|nr:hypothetical protein GQ44DRAFT_727037 [Phaeosphaeriaceae sp. PMI808]